MSTRLDEYQIDVGGVIIGSGTLVPVSEVAGLGLSGMRTADVDNPTDDGALPGDDMLGAATVSIEAGIRTPGDPAAAMALLAQLKDVTSAERIRRTPGALAQLRVNWPGLGPRVLFGRWRELETATLGQVASGWIPFTLQFAGTDPRWHSDTVNTLTLSLDMSNDDQGFRAPVVAPITTGVSSPSQRPGWVTNDGSASAWPTLRIQGPCSNPRVWVVETGRYLELGVSLAVGEWIDIETRPGTRWVLRNGSGNAAAALTAGSRLDLFTLPAGRSEVRWTATDYTNTSRLSVSWRDAYSL